MQATIQVYALLIIIKSHNFKNKKLCFTYVISQRHVYMSSNSVCYIHRLVCVYKATENYTRLEKFLLQFSSSEPSMQSFSPLHIISECIQIPLSLHFTSPGMVQFLNTTAICIIIRMYVHMYPGV